MKTINTSLGVAILLLACFSGMAQSGTADKAWKRMRYQDASDLYLVQHKKDSTDKVVIERLAQSNFYLGNFEEAEGWFSLLFITDLPTADNALMYAQTLAANKKYEIAKAWYNKYSELRPEDPRGLLYDKAYSNMNSFYKDSLQWKVFYLSINTEADEYAPMILDTSLYFTSNRINGVFLQGVSAMKREPFTDIYRVGNRANIQLIMAPQSIDTSFVSRKRNEIDQSFAGGDNRVLYRFNDRFEEPATPFFAGSTEVDKLGSYLNSKLHDGNCTYSEVAGLMMYNTTQLAADTNKTRVGSDQFRKLKLVSVQNKAGNWFKKQDFPYNGVSWSTAHPALSEDGNILYFISDMPGGFGGSDIYYSMRTDSSWTEPINMGPSVNTRANEVFPFVRSGELYFSSTGWPGLGGLDIFSVELKGNSADGIPRNLGYPINSSSDDFGFILEKIATGGYFCSNRLRSDDIYSFKH